MSYSITDLITAVGIDKVKVQFLTATLKSVTTNKQGISTVSFLTREYTPNNYVAEDGPVGVVVWLPRAEYDKAREAAMTTG